MAKIIYSYDDEDVPATDILKGMHIYQGVKYPISSKIINLKDVKKSRVIQFVKPDGTFATKTTTNPNARHYSRLWVKASNRIAKGVPKGYVLCVPYDDPNGEEAYFDPKMKVKEYSVNLVID